MTKINTAGVNTSASDACTATREGICWNPINLTVGELGKPRSEWICQKTEKIKSPFKTTTSGFRFPSSFTRILRLSPPRLRSPSSTPAKSNAQRTQHHVACSYCYIVVRCYCQTEPPVEYGGLDAAEHLLKSLQEKESKI